MIACPMCDRTYPGEGELKRCPCGLGQSSRVEFPPRPELYDKPGSAMLTLIPSWALKIDSGAKCECPKYARKMDRWGTKGCELRRAEIRQHLLDQDRFLIEVLAALPKPFKWIGANSLVSRALKLSRQN